MSPKKSERIHALFLAGHPALDFVNTRMRADSGPVDLLQSDEDVILWLKQAGLSIPSGGKQEDLNLLRAAHGLRESIRSLVEARKSGRRGDSSTLNHVLAAGSGYSQLVWSKSNQPRMETVRRQESPESILAPLAEAAAELLTTGNFDLVKHCEDPNCVRWFLDQTKSHRRRWCSMELCGNRHKVAAYRARRNRQYS